MLNIYEFDLDVSWGGGVMVVAAKDEKQALELVDEHTSERTWEFCRVLPDVYANGVPRIITSSAYVE